MTNNLQPVMSREELYHLTAAWDGHHPLNNVNTNPRAWWKEDIPPHAEYLRIPWRDRIPSPQMLGSMPPQKVYYIVRNGLTFHDSILDVGGYDGIWAWVFRATRKAIVDVCREALEKYAKVHTDETYCCPGSDIGSLFKPSEFDLVLIMDALEHMTEEEGLECLDAAEEIAKHQVIIYTPDGYMPYHKGLTPYDALEGHECIENMTHLSGWPREIFEKRGYHIETIPDQHYGEHGPIDALICFLNK